MVHETHKFENSSRLVEMEYHQEDWISTPVLTVTFARGRRYKYYEVPYDVYIALKEVESVGGSAGQFFDKLIRTQGYKYEELKG